MSRRKKRSQFELKSPEQFDKMRRAGIVVARTLALVEREAKPGVTTAQLDKLANDYIRDSRATPSFLGYHGFTGSICTSRNSQIVHGVPGPEVLEEGDLISIDCGAIVDGWHADAAITVLLDGADESLHRLSTVTRESLWAGIRKVKAGATLGDIGAAIESTILDAGPYGVVEDYVGHGIGSEMHMPPNVPNYGAPGQGHVLEVGMAIAIEPMVTIGSQESRTLDDGWTVETLDGQAAAHWEHTVAITESGPIVTTAEDGGEEILRG